MAICTYIDLTSYKSHYIPGTGDNLLIGLNWIIICIEPAIEVVRNDYKGLLSDLQMATIQESILCVYHSHYRSPWLMKELLSKFSKQFTLPKMLLG
jgi:hypothetical protein